MTVACSRLLACPSLVILRGAPASVEGTVVVEHTSSSPAAYRVGVPMQSRSGAVITAVAVAAERGAVFVPKCI